jgi:hypothetical protein
VFSLGHFSQTTVDVMMSEWSETESSAPTQKGKNKKLAVVFSDFLRETITLELLEWYLFLTREFVKTSKVLRKYFRSTSTVLSKVLSKYFGSFYDLPEIKLAEASIFLLIDFSQISKKR